MPIPLFDRNPTTRFPFLTILLILVNLGVAYWSTGLSEGKTLDLVYEHGLVPNRMTQVDSGQPLLIQAQIGERVYQTELDTGRDAVYLSLVSMMFLHGGWLHVISNMWMLWIFGNNVEDRLGHLVFAAFYLLGGVLSCYCQWAIDPTSEMPVIGASGAVWAVLGGYAVTFPKAKVLTLVFIGFPLLMNLPAALVIAIKFGADLVLGFMMLQGIPAEPIAHWAHVGGCVAGVALMPLLGIGSGPPEASWERETADMLSETDAGDEQSRGGLFAD